MMTANPDLEKIQEKAEELVETIHSFFDKFTEKGNYKYQNDENYLIKEIRRFSKLIQSLLSELKKDYDNNFDRLYKLKEALIVSYEKQLADQQKEILNTREYAEDLLAKGHELEAQIKTLKAKAGKEWRKGYDFCKAEQQKEIERLKKIEKEYDNIIENDSVCEKMQERG